MLDDDQATLDLMRLALGSFGHAVTTASTAAEALATAITERPDVMLADLTLAADSEPGADGRDFARAVRAEPRLAGTGLLAVTGNTSADVLRSARDSGFDHCVLKPFELRALLDLLDSMTPE